MHYMTCNLKHNIYEINKNHKITYKKQLTVGNQQY